MMTPCSDLPPASASCLSNELVPRSDRSNCMEASTALGRCAPRNALDAPGGVLPSVAMSGLTALPTVHASSVPRVENVITQEEIMAFGTCHADSETGWERLKEAFHANKVDGVSRELYEVIMMVILGGMLGFVYGGVPASRHARQRYIQQSQASIYHSKLEATGSSYNAASRGMIRYGYRWGWRTAFLAGGYHAISTGVAVYRNKQDILCYTVAGVSTGVLYRLNLGLRGMVGGAFIGGLLGIPCGAALLGFQRIMGEPFIERHRRERAERREQRAQEMALRLQVTPQVTTRMEESIRRSDQLMDVKKREELKSSLASS